MRLPLLAFALGIAPSVCAAEGTVISRDTRSVGVLVASTDGGAVSAAGIEAHLAERGLRISDVAAIRESVERERPRMDAAWGHVTRARFSLDRFLVVDVRPSESGGTVFVRVRAFLSGERLLLRYAEAPADAVLAHVIDAIDRLHPPAPPRERPERPAALAVPTPVYPNIESLGVTPSGISTPEPLHPAPRSGLSPKVRLTIAVDETGRVVSVVLLPGSREPFSTRAMEYVRRWRYEPLLVDGKPAGWSQTIEVGFRLPDSHGPGTTLGDRGTHEIALLTGLAGGRSSSTLDGKRTERGQNEVHLALLGTTFPANGFAFQGRLAALRSIDTEHRTELAAGAGLAFFNVTRDSIVGPQVTVTAATRSVSEERRTGRRRASGGAGFEGTAGVAARMQLKRIRIAVEVSAYTRSFDVDFSGESDASGTVRERGVRALMGVSWSGRKLRDSVAR